MVRESKRLENLTRSMMHSVRNEILSEIRRTNKGDTVTIEHREHDSGYFDSRDDFIREQARAKAIERVLEPLRKKYSIDSKPKVKEGWYADGMNYREFYSDYEWNIYK